MHVACKALASYLHTTCTPLICHLHGNYLCRKCYKSLPSDRNIKVGGILRGWSLDMLLNKNMFKDSGNRRVATKLRRCDRDKNFRNQEKGNNLELVRAASPNSFPQPYLDVAVTWQGLIALMAYVMCVVSDI